MDAAALVFAHAVLDDTALQYCRVSALAGPEDWERRVLEKKVTVQDVKARGIAEVLRELVEAQLKQLERESLVEKVECLLRCCRPPTGFAPVDGFEFSMTRLRAVDQLRHDAVHGDRPGVIPSARAELEYLFAMGGFLSALVGQRYGLMIDPAQELAELEAFAEDMRKRLG